MPVPPPPLRAPRAQSARQRSMDPVVPARRQNLPSLADTT